MEKGKGQKNKKELVGDSSAFLYLSQAKTEKQAERNESFDLFPFSVLSRFSQRGRLLRLNTN